MSFGNKNRFLITLLVILVLLTGLVAYTAITIFTSSRLAQQYRDVTLTITMDDGSVIVFSGDFTESNQQLQLNHSTMSSIYINSQPKEIEHLLE